MRLCLIAAIPILIATARAPVPWTTSGSTTFPQPLVPGCVSFVLQKSPGVDSAAVSAASARTFDPATPHVGPAPPGSRFAEVRFAKASGSGTLQQLQASEQVRITAVWRWYAQPVADDSVRAVEAWLQQLVDTISQQCGGRQPVDTLQFRHSWESPS